MVFQSFNLFAHKTILENVTLGPIKVRGQKQGRGREAGQGAARPGRRRPPGREVPRPALRRPAAAGRDRPGARDGPQGDALRRADLGARPRDDQRGPRRHGRPRQAGHDDDRRHPRDGLRPDGGRPGRLHGRRRRSSRRTPPRSSSPTRRATGPRTSSARSSSTDHAASTPHIGGREPGSGQGEAMRFIRTKAAVAGLGLALQPRGLRRRRTTTAASSDVEAEDVEEAKFEAGTTMAELVRGRARSRSAPSSTSPASACAGLEGEPEGFDVEIAKIIAGALGIAEDNIELEGDALRRPRADDRGRRGRLRRRDVHDQRRAQGSGSPSPGPYYVAGQQLMTMVRQRRPLEVPRTSLKNPDGKVCSVTGSTPSENIKQYLAEPQDQLVAVRRVLQVRRRPAHRPGRRRDHRQRDPARLRRASPTASSSWSASRSPRSPTASASRRATSSSASSSTTRSTEERGRLPRGLGGRPPARSRAPADRPSCPSPHAVRLSVV